jgi:hypothetical protein
MIGSKNQGYLEPPVQIGDNVTFEADGTLVMNGSAATWNDENFSPLAGRGASAPDLINLDASSIKIAGFDGVNTLEEVNDHRELAHSYDPGSDITFHVHWAPTTADSGTVEFFFEVDIRKDGVATPKVSKTLSFWSLTSGTAWKFQRNNAGTIDGGSAGLAFGDQVSIRFYRDPGAGNPNDTYAADAAIKTYGYHFRNNKTGSRNITS